MSKLVSPLIPEPRPQTLIDRQVRLQGKALLESSGWHSVREDLFHWSTQEGALRAVSNSECVWWKNKRGAGRFAYVRGDVDATVKVRVRQAKNESSEPDRAYQFGGLMLRAPKSNGWLSSENYVFNVLGHRGPNGMQVETKSTHFGWSSVSGFAWRDGDAYLRIQRTGTVFTLYARDEANNDWTRVSQYERPDLP
ncbi:MAG: hypothetical protein R3183_09490, partial [Oleiphilaceae bacterium]|nr:hypothetical protein [Oleiphilaceae bacterium]